jgi:hypothetical protein
MAIQIGKYKRPGIFIEEIDKSIFSAAAAAESITNLVIGVSKKGPVNTPIRLTTVTDLETVFGQLDRNLERKGSFFHRTISKMLETTPVFAMNLLVTDDTLDKIEYKSLSSSAIHKNDIKREGPYRRFFDTTGFWSRDTESFINLTKGDQGYNERALALTNLSDRHISVFVVKTSVTGFDRTLLEWYGSVEKMPSYVSQLDYASDYMVDVIVVGGDWSNYRELAVDPRWASYFNANGLIKGQLRNFANDRNITLLAYYEGLSLIPYFRDLNGRNIFIETSINRDTDRTGLFCEFNADLVEKDFYTGLVDLTGNTLADINATEIEFLSYKETISESVELTQVPLDLPGNVTAMFGNRFGLTGNLLPSIANVYTITAPTGSYPNLTLTSQNGEGTGASASFVVSVGDKLRTTANLLIDTEYTGATAGTYSNIALSTGDAATIIVGTGGTVSSVTLTQVGAIVALSSTFSATFGGSTGTSSVIFAVGVESNLQNKITSAVTTKAGIGYQFGEELTTLVGGQSITITLVDNDLVSVADQELAFAYSGQEDHSFNFDYNGGAKTSGVVVNANRTGYFGEGTVYGVNRDGGTNNSTQFIISYNVTDPAFSIVNGVKIDITTSKMFTILSSIYPTTGVNSTYYSVFYIDLTGTIRIKNGTIKNTKPSVDTTDIVLGYVKNVVSNGTFVGTCRVTDITVDAEGYKDFVFGSLIVASIDYPDNRTAPDFYVEDVTDITNVFTNSFKITFVDTNTQEYTYNYAQYRRFKMFKHLVDLLHNVNKDKVSMLIDPSTTGMNKLSMETSTITDIVESKLLEKSFVLNINTETYTQNYFVDGLDFIAAGFLNFYTEDNEFILGRNGVVTKDEVADIQDIGVVGKYSDFYLNFYNGRINTEDFFYDNRLYLDSAGNTNGLIDEVAATADTISVTFINGENAPSENVEYSGYNYIILNSALVELTSQEQIIFPSSDLNTGIFTITNNSVDQEETDAELATALGFNGYYAYEVAENVAYEVLTDVNAIFSVDNKNYLSMYIDVNGVLHTEFTDANLEASSTVDTLANNTFYVQSELSNLKQTIEIENPTGYVPSLNKILVNGARYTELKVGDFLEADTTGVVLPIGQEYARKLTRVLSKRQYAGDTSLSEITCDAKIYKRELFVGSGDFQTTRYVTVDQYATTYKAISLKGFRIREASLPDGTETRQNTILNNVAKGTPLFKALTNKEAFDFRYLVDAFGLGLTERSKQQLVDICGERLDAFGFINMPSIRSFKNSSSPSFVNSEGVLQTEYIAKGGDPESNPAFLYSFGEGTGVSAVGYFTPYVVVNDNGRPLNFPPASYAATTYVRKHISNVSSVTPWTIAAGVTNGRVTNIAGLEIDFDPSDIEFLNPAQINPIVLKKNRGYVIETENTALVLYKSALSYIHVREVLIELERELSRMLLDYQWKFNTPDVRAEIKLRADVICETYVSKNGLFNYFNKMDDENNTSEIIDNQIGVLDTYVEPIKGMGIIVNNITILRTGAIAAGGFLNA